MPSTRPLQSRQQLSLALYASRSRMELEDIEPLVRQCRQRNHQAGITGVLGYTGTHFLQVIEGPVHTVASLMATIRADARHDSFRLLLNGMQRGRTFASWSLAWMPMEGACGLVDSLLTASTVDATRARGVVQHLARRVNEQRAWAHRQGVDGTPRGEVQTVGDPLR
jgi:hypothetical protein